jgi:hypothetical protein
VGLGLKGLKREGGMKMMDEKKDGSEGKRMEAKMKRWKYLHTFLI